MSLVDMFKKSLIDKSNSTGERSDSSLSRDEIFHILRNRRRRYLLHYLKQESQPLKISSIATQVAAWENNVLPKEVTSEQRRRVYNSLHQTHIPTLTDARIIQVNRDLVELTSNVEQLEIYLEVVPENDTRWANYYLTLAGVYVGIIATAWIEPGPFDFVPLIAIPVIFAVALLVSSIIYYYDQEQSRIGSRGPPTRTQE